MDVKEFSFEDISEIERKLVYPLESQILHMMLNEVPFSYMPNMSVLAMAVGCRDCLCEGSIIREFHSARFNMKAENVNVIGCDLEPRLTEALIGYESVNGRISEIKRPLETPSMGDYLKEFRGPIIGDASTITPWEAGLAFTGQNRPYDFIHVNYPDFIDLDNWVNIFRMAARFVSSTGVITTVSEGTDDIERLIKFNENLTKLGILTISPIARYDYVGGDTRFSYAFSSMQKNSN